MNWNGKHRNGVLGAVAACRESIARQKSNGSSSDEAAWLLEKVNPEEQTAALISLVSPLTTWANALPEEQREKWLVWAMTTHPDKIRTWLGYAEDWTMMPAEVCRNVNDVVRLGPDGRLPSTYLLPAKAHKEAGPIVLDNGLEMIGIRLATVTYVEWYGKWYKVHYPKLPSQSAVSRAIRLYLLGILVGREITSTNDLMVYELIGIKQWLLYGVMENGIANHAGDALFHLLISPEIAEQINGG